jgi:hypothetical protein
MSKGCARSSKKGSGGLAAGRAVRTFVRVDPTFKGCVLKRFRNYCGLIKIARSGFPWGKTTKRPLAFPDFLQRGTGREQLCPAFFTESRMQFDGTTKLHRKSGFGLHQLRKRCSVRIRHSGVLKRTAQTNFLHIRPFIM